MASFHPPVASPRAEDCPTSARGDQHLWIPIARGVDRAALEAAAAKLSAAWPERYETRVVACRAGRDGGGYELAVRHR